MHHFLRITSPAAAMSSDRIPWCAKSSSVPPLSAHLVRTGVRARCSGTVSPSTSATAEPKPLMIMTFSEEHQL
jgi:hypothetical protein